MNTELWTLRGGRPRPHSCQRRRHDVQGRGRERLHRRRPRRGAPPDPRRRRLERALRNFNETFPLFVAVVLAVHVTDCAGEWSRVGALLYLGGRTLYLPAYASGIPWVRTICWNIATLGLVFVLVQLVRFAVTTSP